MCINGLIRKIRSISKFMMLKPGKQVITIHRLPNISRSKGNQTLKFGQLIEQNMRKLLMKNHTQDVVKKLFPERFLKNRKWAYLWINKINNLKFYSLFLPYVQVERYRLVLKLSCRPHTFTSYKAFFLKKKKMFGTSFPASFSAWFLKKNISHSFSWPKRSFSWPNFTVTLPILLEILGNICFVFLRFPGFDVIDFEISLNGA